MEENRDQKIDLKQESDMARMERSNKRIFALCLIIFLAFCVTNGWWIWHESQFEDVVMTQTVSSDGSGDVALNGVGSGKLNYYGSESDTDNKN